MKFQLTCYVDETLLGPVTELLAPYSKVIIRLVEGEGVKDVTPTKDKAAALIRRRTPPIIPSKGMGSLLALRLVAASPTGNVNSELRKVFKENGLAIDGAGATLSKLRQKGYLRHPDKGTWRMSAKGEAALRRYDTGKPLLETVRDRVVEIDAHDSANG